MRNITAALLLFLLFGCATDRLIAVKAKAMDAGYTGDLQALTAAAREASALAADPSRAALAHYWAGYAYWQRAVNAANVDPGTPEVARDRAAALAEFDAALAAREPFADAHALAAWLHGWLWNAEPDQKDAHAVALAQHLRRARELEPDNPRVLWESAYVLLLRDPPRGHQILDDLTRRADTAAPRSPQPDWGVPEALMLLAYNRANIEPTDAAEAARLACRALELRPRWHYVKDILLPSIEKKTKAPAGCAHTAP